MKKILLSLLLGIFFYCVSANAQSLPWNVTTVQREPVNAQQAAAWRFSIQAAESNRQFEYMMSMSENSRRTGSVTVSTSSTSLEKRVRKYVRPDSVLRDTYRNFLKLPNTGLNLLMPEKACVVNDGESFEKMLKRCPFNFLAGNGSYFSFRNRDYITSVWADIGIKDNWIFSLGFFNQGILVNLGDVPIENLTLADKGVSYLNNFVPATDLEEADKQYKQFENGFAADGFKYQQVLPVESDRTYALRVVAYNVAYPVTVKNGRGTKTIYPFINSDRKDTIVVFRILKKDSDGTLSILWKELTSNPAPELVIPKPEGGEKQ
jgi:hypothetical protein